MEQNTNYHTKQSSLKVLRLPNADCKFSPNIFCQN